MSKTNNCIDLLKIFPLVLILESLTIFSNARLNRRHTRASSCRRPFLLSNGSERSFRALTMIFVSLKMECSIPQNFPSKATTSDMQSIQPGQSPPKSMLHVNFNLENEEIHERKKKYLTAKYGQHQMSLIKKRLRVEMWMYDQLQILYEIPDDSSSYEVEIDLDELLDIEAEPARRDWLRVSFNIRDE
ncbi:uncharacterized protein TNCV_4631291 [Trichonephila clavipes]|nr:uncharacterized protein TNCV_4631291 [Trichonephila clavipes]